MARGSPMLPYVLLAAGLGASYLLGKANGAGSRAFAEPRAHAAAPAGRGPTGCRPYCDYWLPEFTAY